MINPVPENIGTVLNSPANLKVPKYQREYKWGVSEAGEFWEDLESYLDTPNEHLFLGNLIFDVSEINKKRIWIIDGQQRLTTILILLVACRELAENINAKRLAGKIQNKICFEDDTTAVFLGSRLTASESISDVFDFICDAEWDGVFPEKLPSGKQVKRQSNRVKPIYNYFWGKIKSFDQPALSNLLNTIYSSYIIRIDIEDEMEAFKIFERTNARGIDLEVSDLLKNFLFSNVGDNVEEAWYRITDLSGGTMLKMLKYFYVSKKGKVSKANLYKKLKEYGKKEVTPEKLLEELEEFASFYNTIRTADKAQMRIYFEQVEFDSLIADQEKFEDIYSSIEGLRLFKVTQIFPLLSAALDCYKRNGYNQSPKASKKLITFFKKLEVYHFINNAVCGNPGNEFENLYADYSFNYAQSSDFDEVSLQLYSQLKDQLESKGSFVEKFIDITYQVSTIPLISYIFDRVNNKGLAAGQRVRIYNSDERILRRNHNIEHFYPQNPSEDSNLPNISNDELNNIGNLLCISFRTNSKLGNLTPHEKKIRLETDLEKEVMNIPYVRKFLTDYSSDIENWNNEVISKRAIDLANEAYENVWTFN